MFYISQRVAPWDERDRDVLHNQFRCPSTKVSNQYYKSSSKQEKFEKKNTQIFLKGDAREGGYTHSLVLTPGHHQNCKPTLFC